MLVRAAEEREDWDRIEVARLLLEHREIDRAPVESRRGPGLESPLRELHFLQAHGE
jgi:hypothetical protein